jgi:hypothetical protein
MMPDTLLERLEPERVAALSDQELAALLCELWYEPFLRAELYGSRQFLYERIRFVTARGYFTAQERQGILRTFFASNFHVQQRVQRAIARRRGTMK